LTLVKRLVQLHGGTIEARSEGPGRGSEFIVRLPVSSAPATRQERSVDREPQASAIRGRILVVDDNLDSAESLAMTLRIRGAEIRTAKDGVEAIEAAAEFRPEVVFLDIGMPRLDGYEAARRMRAEPWGKELYLV